jgi:glutathione synthase/RimK-type ligase-like ATP-grasp enzyme
MNVDIALVTFSGLLDLDPDDRPLVNALDGERLSHAAVAWDDPGFDWSGAGVALLRSTWDYHLRLPEFLVWAEKAAARTRLWNPFETIRWNSRKTYLRELSAAGVPVVETEWLTAGNPAALDSLMAARSWSETVVKPVVSGGAHRTLHVRAENLEEGRRHLRDLLVDVDVMVQPYMESVDVHGERSVIWIDGRVSHSVRKRPILKRAGADWAEADPADLDPGDAELATRAISASGRAALYARVDLVRDAEGMARVLELEMIEPTLFFSHYSEAAPRLARALARLCSG